MKSTDPYPRVLIVGCGSVGIALAKLLVADGCTVWGLRRNTSELPSWIIPFQADLSKPVQGLRFPPDLDYIFVLLSSDSRTDEAYQRAYVDTSHNLLRLLSLQGQKPDRIFFVSSTGVYGQSDGEWVDESSPTEPGYFTGRRLLEGENAFMSSPFHTTIVRFAGIYGPDRIRLLRRVYYGQEHYHSGTPIYTNRIHRDDCAGLLDHLRKLANPDSVYLGVDCEPVERSKLIQWLASRLNVPTPPALENLPDDSRLLRSNKRCRNTRILDSGYKFIYPTFREGYSSLAEHFLKKRSGQA